MKTCTWFSMMIDFSQSFYQFLQTLAACSWLFQWALRPMSFSLLSSFLSFQRLHLLNTEALLFLRVQNFFPREFRLDPLRQPVIFSTFLSFPRSNVPCSCTFKPWSVKPVASPSLISIARWVVLCSRRWDTQNIPWRVHSFWSPWFT